HKRISLRRRRAFREKFYRRRRCLHGGRWRSFLSGARIFFTTARNLDMFLLRFRIFAEVMFFAGTNDKQRDACGKNETVPQEISHKRRDSNRRPARSAR